MAMKTTYTVEILRAGQPRAYADSEYEYLIHVDPMPYGDIEKRIAREEAMRKAGKMFGGQSPDDVRKIQLDWAKTIVRALCQTFREKDDQDGKTGMEAYFYPTLKRLSIDGVKGEVRAFIVSPYTD